MSKKKWKKYSKRLLKENIELQNRICYLSLECERLQKRLDKEKEKSKEYIDY